ncbi:Microtubule-associated protein futsch [Halotydeus destructor]|nr:Microtubule-associated protein futsch [Halotydeus destructor]
MEEDLQRVINSDAVPVSSTPVDVLILSRDEANSGKVSGSENVPDSEMTSSVIADLEKKTEIDLTDGRRESISSLPSHNEKYPVSSTTVEVNSVTLEAETEPLLRESDELDPETVAVLDGDTIQVVVIDDKEKEIHEVLKQKDDFAGNSVETTEVKHDVEEKDENIAIIEMKDIVKSEAKVIQEVEDTAEKDFGSAEVVENISEITAIQFQSVTESDANAGDELENLNVLVASHTRADDDVQEKSGRKTESTELTQSSDRNDALDIVSKEPVIAKKDASEENVSEETETRKSSQEKIAQPEITLTGLELDDAKKQLQRGSADISVDSADGISGVVDDRFSSEKRDSLSSRKASVGDSMKAIGDGAMAMIKSFVTVSDDKDATLSTKVDEVNLDEMIAVDGRKESIASVSSRKEESLNSTIDDDVDAVAVQDKQLLVKDHSLESKPVDTHFAVEKRDSLSSKNTSLVDSVKSIGDDAMAMMKSFVASSDAAHENETLSLEADQVNFDEAVSVDSRKESIASVSSHKDDASLNSAAMIKPFVASSDAADENVTLSMKAEEANSNEGDAVDGREEESPLKSKTPDVQVKPSLINEDKVDAKPKASTRSPDSPDQISEKGEDSAASETSAALAHRDSVATVKDAAELPMEQSAALGQSSRTDLGNELKSIPNDAVEFVKQGVEAATGSERSVKQTGLPAALSETSEMPSAVTLPSPKDSTPMVEALENVRSSKIIAGREMSDVHRPSITQDLNLVEPVSLMVESELTGPVLNEKLVSDQVEKDHSEIMNTEIVEGSSISADISIASRNEAPSIVSGSESVLDNETSCITVVDQDNKSGINPTKFSLESSETLSAEQESRKESLTLDADEDSKKPILVGHRRESSTTAFTEQPVESIIEKLQEQGPDVIFAAGEVGIDESTEIAADPLRVDRKNSEGSEPLAMTASALQSTTAGPVSPIGQAVEPKGGSSISTPSMKQPIEEIVEEELTSEAKVVLEESLEQSDSGTVLLRTEKVDESTIVKTIAATPISVTTTCTSTDISTTRSTEVISQNVDDKPKLEDWGKPLGLPNPPEPGDGPSSRRTASKSRTTTRPTASRVDIKPTAGGVKLGPKPTKSTSSTSETKDSPPVYMDLAYVPHHGDLHYCNGDFFKRIQARYYVFSGVNPSREVFNALIEGKKTWEDQTAQVTVIPTHETDTLGFWMSENQDTLEQLHIDVAPPANRCTVTLQDHETSCSAYRLEF